MGASPNWIVWRVPWDYDIHPTQRSVPIQKIDVRDIISSREVPAGHPADIARYWRGAQYLTWYYSAWCNTWPAWRASAKSDDACMRMWPYPQLRKVPILHESVDIHGPCAIKSRSRCGCWQSEGSSRSKRTENFRKLRWLWTPCTELF